MVVGGRDGVAEGDGFTSGQEVQVRTRNAVGPAGASRCVRTGRRRMETGCQLCCQRRVDGAAAPNHVACQRCADADRVVGVDVVEVDRAAVAQVL